MLISERKLIKGHIKMKKTLEYFLVAAAAYPVAKFGNAVGERINGNASAPYVEKHTAGGYLDYVVDGFGSFILNNLDTVGWGLGILAVSSIAAAIYSKATRNNNP